MPVVTRFAPSPTGYLHIGGARTALFNWLYTRNQGGQFLLRIEDTDRERSTDEAIEAILESLSWLGLDWNGDVFYQTEHLERHAEVAKQMVEDGTAYYCYLTKDELDAMRTEAQANNTRLKIRSPWRSEEMKPRPGVDPVVRFRAPDAGGTITINDLVQGEITISTDELDDIILLRSDGTPTYMLSVVVDDHDMKVTDVIRGDDHLTNTFKQQALYEALKWDVPRFAHIPLIHGPDGAKLSKRHGALGAEAYRDMGYLPEAMRNYLLRLGWSHGDDEIISTKQATQWFNIEGIGKSPSRFDMDKLNFINAHYLQETDSAELIELLSPFVKYMEEACGQMPTPESWKAIEAAMRMLTERSSTLIELAQNAAFLIKRLPYTEKAASMLDGDLIAAIIPHLEALDNWQADNIKLCVKDYAEANDLKLGKVFQPIRAGVCGTMEAPDLTSILEILGKDEVLSRLGSL